MILKICSERKDEWSETINVRLMNVHDLPSNLECEQIGNYLNFRRQMSCLPQKKRKVGRPQDEERNQAFVKVAKFLEGNDDEQITVGDLVEKVEEYLNNTESEAYRQSHMNQTSGILWR